MTSFVFEWKTSFKFRIYNCKLFNKCLSSRHPALDVSWPLLFLQNKCIEICECSIVEVFRYQSFINAHSRLATRRPTFGGRASASRRLRWQRLQSVPGRRDKEGSLGRLKLSMTKVLAGSWSRLQFGVMLICKT